MTFVVLDAAQAVFFGNVFQRVDAFLLGAIVFGTTSVGCFLWTSSRYRSQFDLAARNLPAVAGLNVTAAGAWICYFVSIQRIEPAVAFTLFSGLIPVATIAAWRTGIPEAQPARNTVEAAGILVLTAGLVVLSTATLLGHSGFVRGGTEGAVVGVSFAVAAGALIAIMLLYARRLDQNGIAPVAQYALRFPLFIVLAVAGAALGLDDKGPVDPGDLGVAVAVGMVLLAFPIYAVQKAVSLSSALTIGVAAATGPLLAFLMQLAEGRVAYAPATSVGLGIYFLGAVTAALGAARR